MTFSLELKFTPEYKKTLGSRLGQGDIELLNRVNQCKIICNEISQYFDKSLEESSLCWFQILLDRTQERIEGSNFFDEGFSEIFKKDVIAPHASFGTYESEIFEKYFEIDNSDTDSYDEFLDLYADMYQEGRRGCTKLPMLILKNSYVIERKTGVKLRISKQAIAQMGVKLNRLWGFRCYDCSNFDSLHAIKN